MIVRNWMTPNPLTVPVDMLVSEAKRLLAESNLRALPAVDEAGRLRGLITRKMCLRAAENAMRGQDAFEVQYFTNRLKVKDVMVRNPKTVEADDTMESCLMRGQAEGVSQFPVVEDGKVIGLVSATEVFSMAAHVLGVSEAWCGMTLEAVTIEPGTLSRVAQLIEGAGATLKSMITIGSGNAPRRVIVRFCGEMAPVQQAVENAGYRIMEVCSELRTCRDLRRLGQAMETAS